MRRREGRMVTGVICIRLKRAHRERRKVTNDQKARRHEATAVIEEVDMGER